MAVAGCMLPRPRAPDLAAWMRCFENLIETVGMSDSNARNRQAILLAPTPASRNVELTNMNDVCESHARSSGGVPWLSSTASNVGLGASKDKSKSRPRVVMLLDRYCDESLWKSTASALMMDLDDILE